VGGPLDNNSAGAVWVFTRDSKGNWSQQGSKLVGTGAVDPAIQGVSVALSGDGNTALVGGFWDNGGPDSGVGAVWIFTRDNSGNWSQQGSKLVGTGAVGSAAQGSSVALSTDGNTALEGGPTDNNSAGAVWVFTRDSNGNWDQQGSKMVGTGAVGPVTATQGVSVALSADGNTALEGGPGDNSDTGAVWVFTRDNGIWSQQGSKLVGNGAAGAGEQGFSVALSADASTALEGGPDDNPAGAAWPLVRASGFTPVPGSLQQLSVGFDGAMWGINSSQQIYMYNTQTQSFQEAPGDLMQVAVGSNGAVWGVNSSDQVFRYDSSNQSWDYIPSGNLATIAVGADGDVWGLNSAQQIFHFNTTTQSFQEIPGDLAQIAVGFDGAVWGVNSSGQVYRFNPGTQNFQQVPGIMTQIAVGTDGDVWALSNIQTSITSTGFHRIGIQYLELWRRFR